MQALRNGVSAQHVSDIRTLSGVRRMRVLDACRNGKTDPLPVMPSYSEPYTAGIQRTDRDGHDVGLKRMPRPEDSDNGFSASGRIFSEKNCYL